VDIALLLFDALECHMTQNLYVMSLTLRIIFDLFSTVKQHLKVQFEVFFTSIHLRIGDSASSSFEQKELVLESLVDFCKEPSLIVGLYRNYDCELGSSYLFEGTFRLVTFRPMVERFG
jgi:brefeldin A-resistance guanine nucleotide exchange factor 1